MIAAGQVGAADRACKQDVADMGKSQLVTEEHDRTRRVAGANGVVDKGTRGEGWWRGMTFTDRGRAGRTARSTFERGLLIETPGPERRVAKLLPALTVTADELDEGLSVLARAVRETI